MNAADSGNTHADRNLADVSAQRIARVYAEALLDAAEKRGEVDAVLEESASLINDVFGQDPRVEQFLASAAVSMETKDRVLNDSFGGRASELFLNFLHVLNAHGRLELIRVVERSLRELHDERLRRVRAVVSSAVPLDDEQKQRLMTRIRTALQMEPVLEERLEPSLLGGFVVAVAGWLFDGSVRTRLETIRNYLIASSSHEIQVGRDRFRHSE